MAANTEIPMRANTVYTLKSLLERTTKDGSCLLWDGYMDNGVPMVCHDGKMVQVRKLVLLLKGVELKGKFRSCSCGDPRCVEPKHIVQRSAQEHQAYMIKKGVQSPNNAVRIAKIAMTRRKMLAKITQEQANDIFLSDEPNRVLAARNGISPSQVSNIKTRKAWKQHLDFGSPWAGLGSRK